MGQFEYRSVWIEKPEPNSLAHHGVKGMKWGVRRTPQQLGNMDAGGAGGGGGYDPDDISDEFKEEIELLAETRFSKEDVAKLANGEPVVQTRQDKVSDGTVYMSKDTYYRDGNSLKYSSQRGTVDKNGNFKPDPKKAVNVTLEDKSGSTPFQKLSSKQNSSRQASYQRKRTQKSSSPDVQRNRAKARRTRAMVRRMLNEQSDMFNQ